MTKGVSVRLNHDFDYLRSVNLFVDINFERDIGDTTNISSLGASSTVLVPARRK